MSTVDDATIVKMLLDRAGLPASQSELAKLTAGYAKQQADLETLYTLPAVRYESPALSFNPDPAFAEWA